MHSKITIFGGKMNKTICDTGHDAVLNASMKNLAPYYAEATPYETKPGCWNYNSVNIIERVTEKIIGSYTRNYSSMYRTFHPFKLYGNWYALYSKDYTATRIMSLPNCEDIGGETPESNGFCPTDYYVPCLSYVEFKEDDTFYWHFPERIHGFVAGCIWGDDSSWKIQYLDLSKANEGLIKREERFGYIELPSGLNLDQAINLEIEEDYSMLRIATESYYDLSIGKKQGD